MNIQELVKIIVSLKNGMIILILNLVNFHLILIDLNDDDIQFDPDMDEPVDNLEEDPDYIPDFLNSDDESTIPKNSIDNDPYTKEMEKNYQELMKEHEEKQIISEPPKYELPKIVEKKELLLEDLFENFIQPEVLDDNNKWYCGGCKDHVNAKKSMNIWYLPEVLVIHLKRFEKSFNGYNVSVRKITDKVIFPNELNLNKYIDEKSPMKNKNMKYELYAVNNHQSFGMNIPDHILARFNDQEKMRVKSMMSSGIDFGHYYSYVKVNDKWYEFNDETVREVKDIITDKAYILFYRLKQ